MILEIIYGAGCISIVYIAYLMYKSNKRMEIIIKGFK